MGDLSIGASFTLVLRTCPFLLLRSVVYFGIAAAFVVAVRSGAEIGLATGSLAGPSGRSPGLFWGAVGGFGFVVLLLWWLREYFLYFITTSHVAAMVLALDGALLPGPGQIGQAIGVVQKRFREIHVLFSIERLASGTLGTVIGSLAGTASSSRGGHIPAAPARVAWHVVPGFLREVILARPIATAARNTWAETRDALILFAQHRRNLMRNVVRLGAFDYGVSLLAFLIALVPATDLAAAYSGATGPIAVLFAAAFAWSFKQALIEPLATASMLQVYFGATEDEQPDPMWDARLTEASEQFREIKARAVPFVRNPRRSFTA